MFRFTFNKDRFITLRRGQVIAVVCGFPLFTRRITLRPGEFVLVSCKISSHTITVGCLSFRKERDVHLFPGQRLVIRCRG